MSIITSYLEQFSAVGKYFQDSKEDFSGEIHLQGKVMPNFIVLTQII